MKASEAHPGMGVVYRGSRGPEQGIVTSANDAYVFVRFDPMVEHGTACYPRDLDPVS